MTGSRVHASRGFAMPVVVIVSSALLVLAAALLQTVMSLQTFVNNQYYNKLAEEAAEAGVAYATACLENNFRRQTWGSNAYGGTARPDLTQNTGCDGTTISTTNSVVVASDNRIKSEFVVSNLDFNIENGVQIAASGSVSVKLTGTSTVARTYASVIKKTITWDPNLESEQSSSGIYRTCSILSGSVYCWGNNAYGQLGNNTYGDSLTPVKVYREGSVLGNKTVLKLSAGAYFNCLIASDNQVYCWGRNNQGQLGTGSLTPTTSPKPLLVGGALAGKTVTSLGVTSQSVCATTDIGDLYCWGDNAYGQLGDNTTTDRSTPTLVAGPSKAAGYSNPLAGKAVTGLSVSGAFNEHMCVISEEKAYCWGKNYNGEVGVGTRIGSGASTYSVPQYVSGGDMSGKKVIEIAGEGTSWDDRGLPGSIAAGHAHTCALAYTTVVTDAKVYCWGSNLDGQLGMGNSSVWGTSSNSFAAWVYTTPQAVISSSGTLLYGKTITDIGVNAIGACAIADSRAYCWGGSQTLGNGSFTRSRLPVQVNDDSSGGSNGIFLNNTVDNLIGGAYRFCARVFNKSYCWGANSVGQIGDGTTNERRRPTEALFLRPQNNHYIF